MTDYVVSSGQTSNGITLNSGDTMEVQAGGSAGSLLGQVGQGRMSR